VLSFHLAKKPGFFSFFGFSDVLSAALTGVLSLASADSPSGALLSPVFIPMGVLSSVRFDELLILISKFAVVQEWHALAFLNDKDEGKVVDFMQRPRLDRDVRLHSSLSSAKLTCT
jgi:hypothetical protein